MFISTKVIKDAIVNSSDIVSFIKKILDDINDASLEIFNLQVTSNKYSHTEFSFVDANFLFKDSDNNVNYNDKDSTYYFVN